MYWHNYRRLNTYRLNLRLRCIVEKDKSQKELQDLNKSAAAMKKDLDLEKQKKMQAVNKLAEVMNRKDMVPDKKKNRVPFSFW